jgi:hypothetical protein
VQADDHEIELIASFTVLPHGVVAPFKEELFHTGIDFTVGKISYPFHLVAEAEKLCKKILFYFISKQALPTNQPLPPLQPTPV